MSEIDKTEAESVLDDFARGNITEAERDEAIDAIAGRGRPRRLREVAGLVDGDAA